MAARSEMPRHDREQLFVFERFGDVLVSALLQAPELVALLILAAHQDDARVRSRGRRLQLPADLEPVLLGQQDVEQNHLRLLYRGLLQSLLTIDGRDDLIALGPEYVRHHIEVGWTVIDHEDGVVGHTLLLLGLAPQRCPSAAAHSTRTLVPALPRDIRYRRR